MKRLAAALLLFASPVLAQATWYSPPLALVPPPRDTHAMTTEPTSGKVILFGGVVNDVNQMNDTWEWDGSTWTQAQPSTSPSARESHWLAPDGQGGVILFGGEAFYAGGTLNDTWRYFQGQWTQLSPAHSPPPRRYHRMVSTGQGILLFGGFAGSPVTGNKSDTWEWNGADWIQHSPATSPPARSYHGMAYDPTRNRVIVFGGRLQQNQYPNDTWEWDGTNWTQMNPATVATDARFMDFDPSRGSVVSYGGITLISGNWIAIAESWEWDGTNWSQLTVGQPNPGARWSPIAWSPLSGGLLVQGGHAPNNDTWLTVPTAAPASHSAFGSGCPGPNGTTPILAGVAGSEPRLGMDATIEITGLPMSVTVPVFVYGLSNTQDPGPPSYNLPIDLGPLGWPGCQQLISDDALFFAITTTGEAQHSISVPLNLALLGYELHSQVFVLYSPSGVAVSNGVTGLVGL